MIMTTAVQQAHTHKHTNTHEQVGKAMSSNESAAYEIMRSLDVDYVLVIFGGVIGFSGDDINKFLWMVRIAEGEHPRDIKVVWGGGGVLVVVVWWWWW